VIVSFEVAGTPAPKGSARAVLTRGPNPQAVLASGSSDVGKQRLKSWEQAVRERANVYVTGRPDGGATGPIFVDVPLFVQVVFRLMRPASHWRAGGGLTRSAPPYPSKKPDLDKLVRGTMDAMKGSIYDDDARIVAKIPVKLYAAPGREGATITVMPMTLELLRSLVGDAETGADELPGLAP
jgi:Holliday junction resolvase RusA-like endonuclease